MGTYAEDEYIRRCFFALEKFFYTRGGRGFITNTKQTLIPKVSRTLSRTLYTVPRLSRTRTNKSWNAFVELGRAYRAARKAVRLAAYKKS